MRKLHALMTISTEVRGRDCGRQSEIWLNSVTPLRRNSTRPGNCFLLAINYHHYFRKLSVGIVQRFIKHCQLDKYIPRLVSIAFLTLRPKYCKNLLRTQQVLLRRAHKRKLVIDFQFAFKQRTHVNMNWDANVREQFGIFANFWWFNGHPSLQCKPFGHW